MILFLGKYLKDNLKLYQNLRKYFGINHFTAIKILSNLGLHLNSQNTKKYIGDFFSIETRLLKNFFFEKELKDKKAKIITKLKLNGSYSGFRFSQGLPVNGQRTRTNRKTARKLNKSWDQYDTNKITIQKKENFLPQNKFVEKGKTKRKTGN